MLIKALCDYYDILAEKNIVLPDGYSSIGIHYIIALTSEGKLDDIIDCRNTSNITDKKGKIKEVKHPKDMLFPKRSEKPAIASNFIEHRPTYIFGILEDKGVLTALDSKDKARKSHEALVNENLKFIENIDTPLVNAYRRFLETWQPTQEIENSYLINLGKNISKSNYSFCLSGHPEKLLQDEPEILARWEQIVASADEGSEGMAQCAISGTYAPIARIHHKIKGVMDGNSSGNVLISFKNPSEESYGKEQSYNSNISEAMMSKYCEALNYLLKSKYNHYYLDGITFVYWAATANNSAEASLNDILFGSNDKLSEEETQALLNELLKSAKMANVLKERLQLEDIDDNVDFYIVGIKPNSSRLAIKFFYRRKFGELLYSIARHQLDISVDGNTKPLSLWQIGRELVPPKSKNAKVDPALITKLFEAIVYNRPYPPNLLAKLVQRVKTDSNTYSDKKDVENKSSRNEQIYHFRCRVGLIKACLNRYSRIKNIKEEFGLSLDVHNTNQAYLCGRLFACLEHVQDRASGVNLNRTIKDSYFGAATSNPNVVFPQLLKLYSFHAKKLSKISKGEAVKCEKLIGGIMEMLEGKFPGVQVLNEQGKFIIGYYQQKQEFFKKNMLN